MRNRLVLVLALILGLLAAFLAYNYLNNAKHAADNQFTVQVVTATQDIPADTAITGAMVALKPFPQQFVTNKEIIDLNEAVGRVTVAPISAGEVLMDNLAVKPGASTGGLANAVPNGMRAMTVAVDEVSAVANMINRGDRVDIIGVISGGNAAGTQAVLVLQNIEVLMVGNSMAPTPTLALAPATPYHTITLAVDPQSALKLKMAVQSGNISFLLRPSTDKSLVTTVPFTINGF